MSLGSRRGDKQASAAMGPAMVLKLHRRDGMYRHMLVIGSVFILLHNRARKG